MTAALVGAGSSLLPGELGVRIFMVLLSTATLYLAWRLVLPVRPALFWLLALAMPVLHLGGFVAVPDVPLLFGTLLFLTVWQRWLEKDDWPMSLALAAVLILLAYTKYHGALLFLFALLPNLQLLRRPRFWLICGLVGLALLPHLWWQYQHDWLTFRYHLKDRAGDAWKLRFVPEYLLGQLAIWGPLTSLFLWVGVFKSSEHQPFRTLVAMDRPRLPGLLLPAELEAAHRGQLDRTHLLFPPLVRLPLAGRPRTLAPQGHAPGLGHSGAHAPGAGLSDLGLRPGASTRPRNFITGRHWAALVAEVAGDVPVVFLDRYQRPSKYLFYSGRPGYCVSTNVDTGTQYDLLYRDGGGRPGAARLHCEGASQGMGPDGYHCAANPQRAPPGLPMGG
jgi:hypothetical protein